MQRETIPIHGVLTTINSKVDGSAVIKFETQELEGESMAVLWDLRGKSGYCCFSPDKIKEIEVPDFEPLADEQEKPHIKLGKALYVLHKQMTAKGHNEAFNAFYERYFEYWRSSILKQLDK